MANLTLTIEDHVLKRARVRALEMDTSVNALIRSYLYNLIGLDAAAEALEDVAGLAANSKFGSGGKGRHWHREDLYDR